MANQIFAQTRGQLEQRRVGVTTRILFLYRCLGLVQREADGCPDPAQYAAMEKTLWEKVADARAGLSALDKEIETLEREGTRPAAAPSPETANRGIGAGQVVLPGVG